MTITKMIKILSSYEDRPMFETLDIDKYDFEKDEFTNPVREVILLSEIIEEFKAGSGIFFNEFRFGSRFKELVKCIETDQVLGRWQRHYDDSKQEFIDKWPEYHPDETYEEFKEKMHRRDLRKLDCLGGLFTDYFKYSDLYSVYADLKWSVPKSTKYHR